MKALILAAGYATRLHPYTRLYPKTLLPVGGRPLLDSTVRALAAAPEIGELVLVTNSRFLPLFKRWHRMAAAARLRPFTVLDDGTSSNETRRGTVGDLVFAIDRLGLDDDLLVVCSDKLFDFSIPAFLQFARDKGGGANTCLDVGDPAKIAGRHGCALLDPDGRIIELREKPAHPASSIESIAFYLFPRATLPLIRAYAASTTRVDAPGTLMEWLCTRTPMYGWMIDGDCLDVGDPASYHAADARAWESQGTKIDSIEVLVDGRNPDEAALARLLDRLEAEPAVTMVHLAVAPAALLPMEAWVTAHPRLLPLDVLQSSLPLAELARSRGCSLIIELDALAAAVDVAALLPLTAPVLVRGGRIAPL